MGIGVTTFIKTSESDLDLFAQLLFVTFNVKDYYEHESLNYGGRYYRFWMFGIEFLLYRNWNLDSSEPIDHNFIDYNYYFELEHEWDPAIIDYDVLSDSLHLWVCQHIAFTLDVETGYQTEADADGKSEIRTFKRNPDYVPYTDTPALLANVRLTSQE